MVITEKDWSRMSDLVLSGKDGSGVASTIKDKNKAIARYVAGLKLSNDTIQAFTGGRVHFFGYFSAFGNRALELGATLDEIKNTYCETSIPGVFLQKMESRAGKKLRNRFVGDLSKKILDAGMDINFLPHNGNAITGMGRDAMARNGRKWTIGYKAEVTKGAQKFKLTFDAITDEGNGPTSYVIVLNESDAIFKSIPYWHDLGKLAFFNQVMECLNKA
jgi:hypothetical protein